MSTSSTFHWKEHLAWLVLLGGNGDNVKSHPSVSLVGSQKHGEGSMGYFFPIDRVFSNALMIKMTAISVAKFSSVNLVM